MNFTKIKYQISHQNFNTAIRQLKIYKEKDEKMKILKVPDLMDQKEWVFDYNYTNQKGKISERIKNLFATHSTPTASLTVPIVPATANIKGKA